MGKKWRQRKRSAPFIEALEPRVLFSADVFGGVFDAPGTDDPLDTLLNDAAAAVESARIPEAPNRNPEYDAQAGPESGADGVDPAIPEADNPNPTETPRHELVVVDTATPDYQRLVDDLLSQATDTRQLDIVLLDAGQDGISRITQALDGYQDLDAVHLISHGSEGAVRLGGSTLDLDSVLANSSTLNGWGNAFSEDGDFLIYGCNLAASTDGQALVDAVGRLTGADVAASDDLTGSTALGGDWDLEVQFGQIETALAVTEGVQSSWSGTLAVASFQEGVSGYTGTQDTEIQSGQPDADNGTDGTVGVDLGAPTLGDTQILIRFDHLFGAGAGRIPYGSTINSADLVVDVSNAATAGDTIALSRMLTPWNQDASWNSLTDGVTLGGEAAAPPDTTLANPDTSNSVTFSGLETSLQAWSNGEINYGWVITTNSNDAWVMRSSEWSDASLRPRLSVDYTAPVVSGTIADDLSTGDFTGNSGTVNWSGDWVELDGTAGAGGGDVRVTGGELVLSGPPTSPDGPSAAREADLSGASSATLSFDFRTGSGVEASDPDRVVLEVSSNGGSSWTTLENFDTLDGVNSGSRSYDITAYIASDTQVRFRVDNGYGGPDEFFYVDNVQIAYSNSAPSDLQAISTVSGGLSLNEDGGNNAYLKADDGGAILGGLSALTAEVRFSMDSFPNSTNFFSYATASDDNVFKFNIRDNGDLSFSLNSTYIFSSALDYRTLADGDQHTLSVTWDSSGGLWEMFVDGVSVDSGSGLQSGVTLAGGGTLVMGNDQDSVDGGYDTTSEAAATLYDARIFNSVRSDAQIAVNYACTLPYDESGMIANWTFNDLSTSGVIVDTVSGNNLTVQNVGAGGGFVSSTPELTFKVQENATTGTVVGSVKGIDPNAGDTLSYSLLSDAGGRFDIDSGTGEITVADGSLLDYDTNTSHTVTVQVSDGSLTYDEAYTISIIDMDKSPVNLVPGAQSTNEDTTLTFSAGNGNLVSISDDSGETLEVTLLVTNGTLTLSHTTGLAFNSGANGSNSMMVTGTVEDINSALNGLQYDPTADYNGSDTLTLTTADSTLLALNIDANLQGYYEFSSADPGNDSSPGGGDDGLVNGATVVNDPTRGDVLSLEGNDDYLDITGPGALFGSPADITLSAWVNYSSVDTFGGEVISLGNNVMLRVDDWAEGVTGVFYDGSTWQYVGSNVSLADGNWHHIAFTFDDTANTQSLYIDGVLVASETQTSSINYGAGSNTRIGANASDTDNDLDFNGLIDEARIYDRTLSASEIADLVSSPVAVSDSDTVAITVTSVNDAPVVTTTGGSTAYSEQATATVIDAGLTLVDPDGFDGTDPSDQFVAVINITGNYEAADTLGFTDTAKIEGSLSGSQLTLTVIGGHTAAVAEFEAALQSVTFYNGSDNPGTLDRTISFSFDDGIDSSNTSTKTIHFTATNDDPTNTGSLPTDVVVTEDTPGYIDLSSINIEDVDAGNNLIQVTLSTSNGGVLTASSDFDVIVTGSGFSTMTLQGSVSDLNNFFSSASRFQYSNPTAHLAGDNADTIQITVNDLGNTGSGGGTNIDFGTVNVDITPVNDAPVANADPGNYTNELQALNPLGYWRLGESSGAAADLGSSANSGTYNGGTLSQTGGISGDADSSVHFDGTSDYIEIDHSDDYLLDEGTIQLWFNADNVANGDLQHLFSKDSQGNDTGGHVSIYLTASGYLEARMQSASASYVINSSSAVSQGDWHHVAFSFGANGMALYVDGQVVETDSYTGGMGTTSGGIGNYEQIAIGGGTQNSGDKVITPVNQFFTGNIDEVAILDSQLDAQTIQQLYDAGTNQFALYENETLSVAASSGVLANDTDIEGDTLTVSEINGNAADIGNPVTLASGALVTLNTDGSLFYDPNGQFETLDAGQSATDSFNYTVSDGNGGTETTTVTITINGVEYAPVITDDGSGYSSTILDLAPEGYWRLGESSGSTAVDETGNHNGTYTGTTLGVDGAVPVNTAVDFNDGAGDHVDVGNFDVNGTGITMMGWFNADDFDTGDHRIISKADSSGDGTSNHSWMLSTLDSGGEYFLRMRLEAGGTTDTLVASSGALNPGQWYFAVATYDSATGEMKLYLDGNEVASSTHSVGGAVTTDPSRSVVIGGNPSGNKLFDGQIDEVAIFDYAVDMGQVQDLYDARNGTFSGTVTEGNIGDAPVTASGVINISDEDSNDNPAFNDQLATPGLSGYGTFTLTSGTWTYTLDQSAVQDLDAGDVVNDTITFTATDGSTQQISVSITGTDDASVITGTVAGAVVEGDVGDAPVTATGSISIGDVDHDDSPTFNDVAATSGDNGYGSFVLSSGTWTYTLDQSAVQDLDAGDVVNDTITFSASDGSTQQVSVTITGADDSSVITGTVSGAVVEGDVGDASVTASGSISISDADADDSPSFADVASTAGDNGYGSFELVSGAWTYTLDQSAVQDLDVGDVVNDTITFTATDGSTQQISVSITGTDDASVIAGTVSGAVLEGDVGDAPVTATGSISISDVDDDDSPTFADVASTVGDNGYGSFVLSSGTWTYTLDQSAVQDLDAGDLVSDTITFTASDGSTQQITVSITGTDDASVISGTTTGAVVEGNVGDAPVTATGSIAISDVDADDSPSFADVASTVGDNGYGSFVLSSGTWTYTLDQNAVQDLDAGDIVNDTITFTASDGSTQQITVSITGTDDASVISGTTTGAVVEGNVGDAPVTATGSISISDVDADDSPSFADVASTVGDNGYGSFVLTGGAWTYTLDQSAVQHLDAGDIVNDTITYTATDGSTQQISVSITGADDASVISGTTAGAVVEGNVGDAPVTATGSIAISDVDADDSPSFADVASTVGDNGYGSFVLSSGTWTYTLDQNAVQDLDAGDIVNDTITYTASDGISSITVTVTIKGADEGQSIGDEGIDTETEDDAGEDRVIGDEGADTETEDDTEEGGLIGVEGIDRETEGGTDRVSDGVHDEAGASETPEEETSQDRPIFFDQESVAEDSAWDEEPDVLVGEPVALPPMDDAALVNILADARQDSDPNSGKDVAHTRIPPKFIDLKHLNIAPFELEIPALNDLKSISGNDSFVNALEELDDSLEEAMKEEENRSRIEIESAIGIVLSLSAGFVSWVLRAGSLFASLMSVLPLWRQFDPLPILAAAAAKRRVAKKDQNDADKGSENTAVETIFDQ